MPFHQLAFLFVNSFLIAIAFMLLVPIGVLFVECSASLFIRRRQATKTDGPRSKVAVLVPAHDEAQGIGATLSTIVPQLRTDDRLVVIADNCTDETATVARQSGAIAIERQDADRRGKGYALDFGLRFLESDPPDVVIMVDADCNCYPGTIDRIADLAATSGKPVQAIYLMEQPPNPTPKDSVSTLAFLVKNLVRPTGLERLGLPALLTGTGMAFPWSVIRRATLASGNIVEDMQLSVDLAIAGYPTLICPNTKVLGCLPQQGQAAKNQRTRWEHGHLQTLLTQTPKLLKAALQQKRFDLLALGLDLVVPPLSLLVMIWGLITALAFILLPLGASSFAATLLAIEGFLILISIVGAWAKFGRNDISGLTLLAVPFYLLWKIPLYLNFLVRRQTKWIRTERDTIDATES